MSEMLASTVAFSEPLTSPPRVHHAGTLAALFRGKNFSSVNTWAPSSPVLDDGKRASVTR